jgi:hypothetical protein
MWEGYAVKSGRGLQEYSAERWNVTTSARPVNDLISTFLPGSQRTGPLKLVSPEFKLLYRQHLPTYAPHTHSQWETGPKTDGGGVRSPANVVVALRKIHWPVTAGGYKEISSILGWPIPPSYMSPNAGGRGEVAGVSANEYSCTLWRSISIFNLWVTAINSADSPIPPNFVFTPLLRLIASMG